MTAPSTFTVRVIAVIGCLALLAVTATPAAARLDIGLDIAGPVSAPNLALARTVGAKTIRVEIAWSSAAPEGTSKPAGFTASDPADPQYRWEPFDTVLRTAAAAGTRVIVLVSHAPAWAEGPNRPSPTSSKATDRDVRPGAWDPDPQELALFARAIARRYGGSFPEPGRPGATLPRIRDWEFWNEQNLPYYFDAPHPVPAFRRMLNAFYDNVKAVHKDNVVSIGGFAPVSYLGRSISPLKFAAELMCLRRTGKRFVRRGCPTKAKFDVIATHPYSLAATPTKHAYHYDDLLVADTGKLTKLLRTAERMNLVLPAHRRRPIWVTEWSWFTNPPNSFLGDAPAVAARYTALSLYLMWRAGVTLVVWRVLIENPAENPRGGGLFTAGLTPKATARALRFPFFARVSRGRGYAWGKAPAARRPVVILRRTRGRWRTVARGRSGPDGIFQVRFAATRNASFAARVAGRTSRAYDSTPVPPRRTHAFG
ncbi:MAG: hypothetical protein ACR2NB_04995 [Solirubrobacteraceae bacterium]